MVALPLMVINSMIMLFIESPILLMVLIITQTFLVCVMIKATSNLSWISFILFLVFVGGLLVLFIYIVSLTPNTQFMINKLNFFIISTTLLVITLISTLFFSVLAIQKLKFLNMTNYFLLSKLYSYPSIWMTFMAMTYLLLVLIVVVYIILMERSSLKSLLIKS
uniref:NADH dehydrogenase subunit 6 n=1 Tax=Brachystomella parvula TaxID=187611 RepID=A0A650BJX9_9HEXA|nr:NADH dehydrogenase subunit 6 [Brachystomella parvula]